MDIHLEGQMCPYLFPILDHLPVIALLSRGQSTARARQLSLVDRQRIYIYIDI